MSSSGPRFLQATGGVGVGGPVRLAGSSAPPHRAAPVAGKGVAGRPASVRTSHLAAGPRLELVAQSCSWRHLETASQFGAGGDNYVIDSRTRPRRGSERASERAQVEAPDVRFERPAERGAPLCAASLSRQAADSMQQMDELAARPKSALLEARPANVRLSQPVGRRAHGTGGPKRGSLASRPRCSSAAGPNTAAIQPAQAASPQLSLATLSTDSNSGPFQLWSPQMKSARGRQRKRLLAARMAHRLDPSERDQQ